MPSYFVCVSGIRDTSTSLAGDAFHNRRFHPFIFHDSISKKQWAGCDNVLPKHRYQPKCHYRQEKKIDREILRILAALVSSPMKSQLPATGIRDANRNTIILGEESG